MTDASLSVLLSQALIAFAIEFDNEFELQMSKTYARPFLVSIVMWSNFMRFVRDDGTTVDEIARRSCASVKNAGSVVGGMERWGYTTVDHDPASGVPPRRKGFGSATGVTASTVVRPSVVGRLAIDRWRPLVEEIESRWRSRIGAEVERLRDALRDVDGRSTDAMPRFLPIVGGPMFAELHDRDEAKEPDDELPALLSRVLLAFTLEVERGAPVSLPIGENVLRVLDETPTPVKDLPQMTGTSKEAVGMSMTALRNLGYVEIGSVSDGRGKAATLTAAGGHARRDLVERIGATEIAWRDRFGIGDLRAVLLAILDRPGGEDGVLSAGLVTPPGGWRGQKRYAPLTAAFVDDPRGGLPRYPVVLHRGGWPDGS